MSARGDRKKTTSTDGKRSAKTKIGASEILKESFLFQAPDQLHADAKLAERLINLSPDSGRLRSQIESLGAERKQFSALAQRHERDAQNIAPEQRKLRASASSASAQAVRDAGGGGTNAAGSLRTALRQAKARQGIVLRGDEAIKGQRLKDRLKFARSALTRRVSAIDLGTSGQQIKAGIQLNAQNARDSLATARSGAAGAAIGGFAGILKGNKDDNGSFFDFGKKNSSGSKGGGFLGDGT